MLDQRVRRFSLTVSDDGTTTSPQEVNDPNCQGWELSFNVTAGDNQLIGATISARDIWENGPASLSYGTFLVGFGGKLYIPFPAFSITGVDFDAVAAGNSSTISIVARTVAINGHSAASSVTYGVQTQDVAAGGATVFNAPSSAIAYKVTNDGEGGPLLVTESVNLPGGGVADTLVSRWAIDNSTSSGPDTGGQVWRDMSNALVSSITIANSHAADTSGVSVWFKSDFRRLK